ncbi:wolframin-like [Mya arenaria]|uniref:wolframin-like n=1 Tax=Mya arenaria TaxID=6604 RepID=UPI0022E53BFE|nr:wolframin-like [Mya arenaria]
MAEAYTTGDGDQSVSEEVKKWESEAAQGNDDSQFKLGTHFLKLADSKDGAERNEYGRKAVRCFVTASIQGNNGATIKLKGLLEDESSWINDDNKEDVIWCVSNSNVEKTIRFAARALFLKINTTDKDVISIKEYNDAIRKMTRGQEKRLLLAAGKNIGDNISETEFVKLLSQKIQGTMTLTWSERSSAFQVASLWEKIAKYPKETAAVVGESALEFASSDGLRVVSRCIPKDQIYLLTLFFIYGFITPKFVWLILPLGIFYISYATLITTTMQMLYKKMKLNEASAFAKMLHRYYVRVDVDQTQSQYAWNSLTPYGWYLVAISVVVVSFSLADKMYIPCSELCVLNSVICGICLVYISDINDLFTWLVFFCNILSSLPVFLQNFLQNFPKVPILTTIINVLSGNLFSVDLYAGLKLNVGIPSICYSLIPVFFIQMAIRKSFSGMYRLALPHLVCYFWFELITTMYPFTTWIGLGRTTVGYLIIPLLVPLSMILFLIGLAYLFIKMLSSDMFGKIVITLLLACIPILLTQTKKLIGGKFDKRFGVLKKILMIMFAILAIIPLIFVRFSPTKETHHGQLSAERFKSVCDADMESFMNCHALKGTQVVWNGTVTNLKVTSVTNEVNSMLDIFPSFVSKPLRSIYGKRYDCDGEDLNAHGKAYCSLMVDLGYLFGLENYDKFAYNIGVELSNNMGAVVNAGSGFKNTFLALKIGDELEIKATIADALARPVTLQLMKLKCLNRDIDAKEDEEDDQDFYNDMLQEAFSVAFNFFWHPLVEFVPQTTKMEEITE